VLDYWYRCNVFGVAERKIGPPFDAFHSQWTVTKETAKAASKKKVTIFKSYFKAFSIFVNKKK
jgi:hypothetical protein